MKSNLKDYSKEELVELLQQHYEQENNDIAISCSHDVKNPLGIIELSLGLLEDKLEELLNDTEINKADKIRALLNNITVALARCEKTMDSTVNLRKSRVNLEKEELHLRTFIDDYYLFAKVALKRSKINYENATDEDLKILFEKDLLIKPFYQSLLYLCEHIKSQSQMQLKVYATDNTIFFEMHSSSDQVIELVKSTSAKQQFIENRLYRELDKSKMTFESKIESNKVIGLLKFM